MQREAMKPGEWKNAVYRALPLGVAVGVSLPVAALVRVETLWPPALVRVPRLGHLPDGDWPGGWSEAARTAAELQATGFGRVLALVCGLALLAWLAALAGTVLSSLRKVALERREWALRSAVGGTRRQLRLDALREGARVAVLASGIGTLIAATLAHLLLRTLPPQIDVAASTAVALLSSSWLVLAVLLVTALTVMGTPLLLLPKAADLRNPARGSAGDDALGIDVVRVLAAGQIAACVGIAASAALFLGGTPAADDSILQYPHARDTLVLRVRLPDDGAGTRRTEAWDGIRAAVAGLPEVRAAALTSPGAVLGHGTVDLGGAQCAGCGGGGMAAPVTFGRARHLAVDPNFFDLLDVPVESVATDGRSGETAGGAGPVAPRVVVDRTLHRDWFQGTDVSGRRVWLRGTRPLDGPGHPVAGVAHVPRPAGVRATREPIPAAYLPFEEYPPVEADIVMRGSAGSTPEALETLIELARSAVATKAPGIRAEYVGRLDRMLAAEMAPVRWLAIVAIVLAGTAFALAVLGCGGAMFEHVRVRRAEIGLRRAVGARRGDIMRLVSVDTGRLVLAGAFAGAALAASAGRALPTFVAGLAPLGAETIIALAAMLAAVGLAGSAVAGVRAVRLDVVEALRG